MDTPERKRLADGFSLLSRGVNEGQNPALLSPAECARAINATFRGGFASTRPPFMRFPLSFQDFDTAEWFRTHNVQGQYLYRPPVGNPAVVVSVGGRIFRIDVTKPRNVNVQELVPPDGYNPSNRPHVWMVQAEQWLIIQDGQSAPILYDGAVVRRSQIGAPAYEVPVGTAMEYGLGRLIVVRPNRRSYIIGDIVHGGTEVIQFTENNYLNEGGDVTVPIQGEITSVKILAQIDRSTGQGDLVVFTPYGATSARIGEPRETWKNIQFQLVALLANGATSHNSVTMANGDLFFRSLDGIRSLAMARREFQTSWATTPLSREINQTLSFDTRRLLDFCSAAVFDNRLLVLCNQVPVTNGCYHRGMAVLDFDLISSMSEKQPPAYDGLWTGLNFTGIVSGEFPTGERCFVFHRNSDGENEMWELLKDGTHDNGVQPIQMIIEGRSMLRDDPALMGLKMLQTGDISLENIVGTVNVGIEFRPDQSPCWTPWHSFEVCAMTRSCDGACVNPSTFRPQYRTKQRFPQPPDDCDGSDNKPVRHGFEFQPRITITGNAEIRNFRLSASSIDEPNMAVDGCTPE